MDGMEIEHIYPPSSILVLILWIFHEFDCSWSLVFYFCHMRMKENSLKQPILRYRKMCVVYDIWAGLIDFTSSRISSVYSSCSIKHHAIRKTTIVFDRCICKLPSCLAHSLSLSPYKIALNFKLQPGSN